MNSKHRRRSGFTLVELVFAVAAGGLLMAGLTSALLLATRALDVPDHLSSMQTASDVVFDLADEIQHAIHFTEKTATSVEFATPDVSGDGNADVIRYAWSGTAGDPLQRTLNHGTPVTVADDVQEFDLEYQTRGKTEDFGFTLIESSTVTHTEKTNGATGDYGVESDKWTGQYFTPNLPTGAVRWNVTEVQLELKQNGLALGQFKVQLRPATGSGTPTSTVLEEVTVDELSLGLVYGWKTFNFSNVTGLLPSQSLCIVVQHVQNSPSCMARYVTSGVSMLNHGWLESSDQGSSWNLTSNKALRFKVRGNYYTNSNTPAQAATRHYVTGVRTTLRVGSDAASRVQTSTPLLNTPESLAGLWEADFSQDPTALDANFDNANDWQVVGGGSFDTNSLVNGVWGPTQSIKTAPDDNFDKLTTVNVRFRNTGIGGDGAMFRLNYDFSGSNHAVAYATLQKQSDGTQTLTVYKMTDASTSVALTSQAGLSAGYVDLRLVLDATQNVLGVMVNDVDKGDFDNVPFFDAASDKFATLLESGSNAEFDYVSIRVSDNN